MVLQFPEEGLEADFEQHLASLRSNTDKWVLFLCWMAKLVSTVTQLKVDGVSSRPPYLGSPPMGIWPNVVLFSMEIYGFYMNLSEANRLRWQKFRETWFCIWAFMHGILVVVNHKAVLDRVATAQETSWSWLPSDSGRQLVQLINCFIWGSNLLWVFVFMLFAAPRCRRVMWVQYPVLLGVMLPMSWLYPPGLDRNTWLLAMAHAPTLLRARAWLHMTNPLSPKACFVALNWGIQSAAWWVCFLRQYRLEQQERRAFARAHGQPTDAPWLDSQPDIVAVLFVQHALITAALRVSFPSAAPELGAVGPSCPSGS